MNELLKKRLTEGVSYVYGLRDPRTHEFFYVGVAVRPDARLDSYREPQHASSEAMRERLRELVDSGHDAEMVLFEKASFANAPARENHHIDRLRGEGATLLNVVRNRAGTVSGRTLTDEKLETIIEELQNGEDPRWLAKRYAVSPQLLAELRREIRAAPTSTS